MTIARVNIVVEGKTEESFINVTLKPALEARNTYVRPILLNGNVNYGRYFQHIVDLLQSDPSAYCTSLVDYYGLGEGFPGFEQIDSRLPAEEKKKLLESRVFRSVEKHFGKRFNRRMFLPYVQMYEFEGLLFSDTKALAHALDRDDLLDDFERIRSQFATPEEINDHPSTAPSKRLGALTGNQYDKDIDGNLAVLEIGLETIRKACPLFDAWICTLESLGDSCDGS